MPSQLCFIILKTNTFKIHEKPEVGIYKRKQEFDQEIDQENKKQELGQESDQVNKKVNKNSTKKAI